jgi:hypothetical protein
MPPGFGLPALEFCLGKDMRGIHSDLAKCVENVGSVAHQTADFGIRARRVERLLSSARRHERQPQRARRK